MNGLFPTTEEDPRAAVRALLAKVLDSGLADALLVPLATPAGDAVAPALVRDRRLLERADPLAPVLPVNQARLVSMLTIHEPRPRVAAVLRSCEVRAVIELVKLQQASWDGLILIGIDCLGTMEVERYAARAKSGEPAELAPAEEDLRPACRICEHPAPANCRLVIRRIGRGDGPGLSVEADDVWAGVLGLEPAGEDGRSAALVELVAERTGRRDAAFAAMAARSTGPEALAALFSTCIRCHNCMTNCPVCYCKTCLFKTTVFDHEPGQYLKWAERKGAARLPADTLLFHLTRLNHMSTSCVGCGLCTSACPVGIEVGTLFRSVAARTQALFDYQAGRSLDDPIPVKNFEVNELKQLGEG